MSSHTFILCLRLHQKLDQVSFFVEFRGFGVSRGSCFCEFETEVIEFFETSLDIDEGFFVTVGTFFAPVAGTGAWG
jgi:hypothetical protein